MWQLLRIIKWFLGSLNNLHSVVTARILSGKRMQKHPSVDSPRLTAIFQTRISDTRISDTLYHLIIMLIAFNIVDMSY